MFSTTMLPASMPAAAKPALKERRKAQLVPRDEAPLMGLSSGKDFVQTNVLEATQVAPKYKEQEEVGAGWQLGGAAGGGSYAPRPPAGRAMLGCLGARDPVLSHLAACT